MKDFADALASKELARYSAWFADNIRLYSPLHEDPVVGKEAVCQILPVVFSTFDNFHYLDVFTGEHTHALIFRADVSGVPLEGVDYLRTDERGLVTEFTVTARPLKAITAFAEAIGAKMQHG